MVPLIPDIGRNHILQLPMLSAAAESVKLTALARSKTLRSPFLVMRDLGEGPPASPGTCSPSIRSPDRLKLHVVEIIEKPLLPAGGA